MQPPKSYNLSRMIAKRFEALFADPHGAPAIIRRLLTGACLSASGALHPGLRHDGGRGGLHGDLRLSARHRHQSGLCPQAIFSALILIGIGAFGIFVVKGLLTYGQQVMLMQIGNRIIADNQRRMFDKLLQRERRLLFGSPLVRVHRAADDRRRRRRISSSDLLITSFGRDLLTLIGLYAVMVIQDPVMSLVGLIVAPPALIVLRKLIRRVRAIMKAHFTGGTRIVETLQETLQGMRIVKAFTLEDEMRRRLDRSVADMQHEADKWARVSNRAGPMMETLGGLAIGICDRLSAAIWSIYRGAEPGGFLSFLAAFLLAYEPAKRLSRLNLELTNHLVGVRMLFEVMDSPPSEPNDDDKPPLQLTTARVEFADVRFAYRADDPVLRGMSFVAEPGKVTALVGPSGGGKSTVFNLLLRFYETESGPITIDGQEIRVGLAPLAAPPDRLCGAERAPVPRHDPRQHPLRQARRQRGRDRRGRARPRMRTISSSASRTATTRRSASTAISSPAASASASRSRAR